MKKEKVSLTLYYIASVLFYIFAVLNFVTDNNTSMGIIYLAIGSIFLCLGSVYKMKANESGNDSKKNSKTDWVLYRFG